ncbi:MAG TPA: glycosyltransferase [Kiritimatiellia bacterium]|nr:glycosyltransferase [Kiritimatiellia bacterium]HMP33703.1 glycosyltransferase [Kiritimatiellia bacterium]
MKILVLAPQPFYQERGTPIAVDLMVRSLCERGHDVHLLVFHEGRDVAYPGLTLHRIPAWRMLNGVRPGLSLRKVGCDLLMFFKAIRLVRRHRPDVIHAVEEAGFMALVVRKLFGIPYIYDMDSSLPDQIVEKFPWFKPMQWIMRALIRPVVYHALLVAPVCEALASSIAPCEPARVVVLRDVSLLEDQRKKNTSA